MSKINRLPKGLQEFLGNTAAGKNPDELSNTVFPQFDMLPFWAHDQIKYRTTTNSAMQQSGGAVYTPPIPQGEVWMPLNFSGYMTGLSAGDLIRMELSVFPITQQARLVLAVSDTYTNPAAGDPGATGVNNQYSVGYQWRYPVLYGAGAVFTGTLQLGEFVSPNETMITQLQYILMRA